MILDDQVAKGLNVSADGLADAFGFAVLIEA
jgi:hypothetical protein